MSSQSLGLIIGGLLPALFFGLSGVFARPATRAGISTGFYLTIIGLAAATVGLVFGLIFPERELTFRSGLFTILVGSTWAIAAGLVAIALTKYGSPISRLVPLSKMNTLVAVIIGLAVFSEWREVNALQILIGAILIVVGGWLVVTS